MNANEVIANLAIRYAGGEVGSHHPIHPNDDVNRSQSTNDVFPSVMHITVAEQIQNVQLPAVASLRDGLLVKSLQYCGIVMLGRTHLQDATPITLGQIASGWASRLDRSIHDVRETLIGLYELAIGATAVGTGLNAPAGFAERRNHRPRFGFRARVNLLWQRSRPAARRVSRYLSRMIGDGSLKNEEGTHAPRKYFPGNRCRQFPFILTELLQSLV
jgi:hypothetical protein